MQKIASSYFLSAALALTILSACAAAFGFEAEASPAGAGGIETRAGEPLSLDALRQRLRETKAISIAGKVGLKFEVDGLVERFRVAHLSGGETLSLREPYDALMARIRALLERDPELARDIAMSREAIWVVMTDRTKFAERGRARDAHEVSP